MFSMISVDQGAGPTPPRFFLQGVDGGDGDGLGTARDGSSGRDPWEFGG